MEIVDDELLLTNDYGIDFMIIIVKVLSTVYMTGSGSEMCEIIKY